MTGSSARCRNRSCGTASDVHYLPALTDILTQRAGAKDRLSLVFEASHEALEPSREPPPPLSLESFRNAWQLGPRSQAGLRFLIGWYNSLTVDDKRFAPDTKTLLALAGRMQESSDALARIKGVSPGVAQRHGKLLVNGLADAARQAKSTDVVPFEPVPYATFAEIRREAWLSLMRAEICAGWRSRPSTCCPRVFFASSRTSCRRADRYASRTRWAAWAALSTRSASSTRPRPERDGHGSALETCSSL